MPDLYQARERRTIGIAFFESCANVMTMLLYKTPPPHNTHHDSTFVLSPGVFTFEQSRVLRNYCKRIAHYDETATKYIVGAGHRNERERLALAVAQLEMLHGPRPQLCPDLVAVTFANAMGDAIYDQFNIVRCESCDREYTSRNVYKTRWTVENSDGSGSSGSRLACPHGHVLYASIECVTD
jgi:hypothetical protein